MFSSSLVLLLVACSEYDLSGYKNEPGAEDSSKPMETGASVPELEETNLGTNFMAVTTPNPLLPQSFWNDFAIVVTNPDEDQDANVTVNLGARTVYEVVVHPDEAVSIPLKMLNTLVGGMTTNVLEVDGAYEVVSDIPIAAYQFSPLHYRSEAAEFSYTNDASMLIPEHVLGTEYMMGSWPTFANSYPGFAAITATQDGTEVTIHSRTTTAAGIIPALNRGDEATVTLDRGDVFQLFGSASASSDLTGTKITSTAPIAVFGGHVCTNVPLANASCDHLEEMMQPTTTWGNEFVMTATMHPDNGRRASSVYRVVALKDNTSVQFNPGVTGNTTMGSGDVLEFLSGDDFVVQADGPIAVYQYMQSCTAIGTSDTTANGDPSMGSGIPQEQARPSYVFLVPDTYETNWVNIVANTGTKVMLDGAQVNLDYEIGGSGYRTGRVAVDPGSHRIESEDGSNITVTVYGYADYTSYLYPGGMNVKQQ